MMSKKQWCVLLCLLIVYLLLGAWFYDEIETRDEGEVRALALEELKVIEELIHKHYVPNIDDTEDDILDKLADYCGKPMRSNTTDIENPAKWDFYHSLFFVITVVTTIGYGNLAPTTPFGRIAMIFYALIGIPISGICMVTLGDFFGKSFTKIYQRWKTKKMENDTTRLSLIAQVALYLIPGFTFFIFIPSVVIMMFEDWPYDVAVYYAFVTLTTIGFGDYVAGVNRPGTDSLIFTIYKLFLLVWIISGLGYVVMVMGFISRGLRSKKMHDIEHALAMNIKKTPLKIRNELRSLLREFVLQKIKSTYRQEFVYTPVKRDRSQSCPDLTIYRNLNSPTMMRKRALSECAYCTGLSRFESLSETNLAENEPPLALRRLSEQSNLLLQVANALGGLDSSESNSSESEEEEIGGVHGFSDEEILASEKFGSGWNLQNQTLSAVPPKMMRQRACSEIKFPFQESNGNQKSDLTWYGPSATLKLQEIREKAKHGKPRSRTLPVQPTSYQTPNLYTRLKNTFIGPKQEEKANIDVESQTRNIPKPRSRLNSLAVDGNRRHRTTSESTSQYLKQTRGGRRSILPVDDRLLEQTSLADFIRALTAISVPEAESLIPQRKLGTASLTPPKQSPPKTRRFAIRPVQSRRTSLMPSTPTGLNPRRLSLRPSPVAENPAFLAPPPYTPLVPENTTRRSIRVPGSNRRFSLRPVTIFPNPSPVQRQVKKTKEKDELKEILNEKL